jgi:hypothetical protein
MIFWRNKAEQSGTVEMADGLALNWWTGFV